MGRVKLVGKNEVEIKIVREAEAHLNSDYFNVFSELFALDVRPHLIPLPMQGSFCINLD